MASQLTYPVKVQAKLDDGLSRWLWLVKWFLAIPHYVVLAFLWMAFVLLSVAAFFSILFTGRYPRAIFGFNVGVLRWSWRVSYYSYGALATDRYPPFTLDEVPDYPVHLEVDYPERLSRGLVLIKWWLLALPHYIIVGLLVGGAWMTVRGDNWEMVGFSLIGILTLIAGVSLLFTGRYPNGIFDLLLGLNRWVIRVAAYAGLMTDAYPPFRIDLGGNEPGGETTTAATPSAPTQDVTRSGWSGGRIISVIVGSIMGLTGLALIIGGGVVLWADQTQREQGFVTSPTLGFSTDAYAVTTEMIEIEAEGPDSILPETILGDARVRATSDEGSIFVGVADVSDVRAYLSGVSVATISSISGFDRTDIPARPGGKPASPPADQTFWTAYSEGSGTQSVTWPVRNGNWSLVVMNGDASANLAFEADVGAEAPFLGVVWIVMLILGAAFAAVSIALISIAVRRAQATVQPSNG